MADIEQIANNFQAYSSSMMEIAFKNSCVGMRNDVLIQGVNNESKKPDKIQPTS
jgi:hypothetical protein